MTRSDGRPAWIAQGQAWVSAKLDRQIDAFNRKLANEAKPFRLWDERFSRLDGDEKARRKERGLAKTQEWKLELALRQAMQRNIEPLRREMQKQDPRLVQFINLPRLKGPGKHFEKLPHPARGRLEDALAELPHARFHLQSYYKKTGRPRGQLTVEQILAERWDLTEYEIRKRRISRARLKRDRQANFVRPK
jgi:hypothetical protein